MGYKSYCWHIGNTSFRVKQLAYKNEVQLEVLMELEKRNKDFVWASNIEIQTAYYDLLADYGLVKGTAKNKAKDAREISSPLVNLGLINDERRPTDVGKKIYDLSKRNDFKPDNDLERNKDSYVYLLQLLKLQINNDDIEIRPFVSFLYFLLNCEYLTKDEFTYLLPMCKKANEVLELVERINKTNHHIEIDSFLLDKIFAMDNYSNSLKRLIDAPEKVSKSLMVEIGMNRKSGKNGQKQFDAPLADLFNECYSIAKNKKDYSEQEKVTHYNLVCKCVEEIGQNQRGYWKKFLGLKGNKDYDSKAINDFYDLHIFNSSDINAFKELFYKNWQLFKVKNTLENYYDLNKRYFSLSDIFTYSNEKFEIVKIGRYYFKDIIRLMLFYPLESEKSYSSKFYKNIAIDKIYPCCNKTTKDLTDIIYKETKTRIKPSELDDYSKKQKNEEFKKLIDSQYSSEEILKILDCFKDRKDDEIAKLITDEATPSTAFEYIVGIAWYRISGEKGYLEDYMNLSLGPDCKPRTHAPSGHPDLLFKYEECEDYLSHDLVIEVTLSESTTQREMEELSVKRHLESNITLTHNVRDYAIFVAGTLDSRIINGFRAYKFYHFLDGENDREGINIIPIDIDILKAIISKKTSYKEVLDVCDAAYRSQDNSLKWHENEIRSKLM